VPPAGPRPRGRNLSTTEEAWLTGEGGFIGRLLHLVQQRKAPAERFEELLRQEVGAGGDAAEGADALA
jgi:hypothetical protein